MRPQGGEMGGLGTGVIQRSKDRPKLGIYCLASRKGARLRLVLGKRMHKCSGPTATAGRRWGWGGRAEGMRRWRPKRIWFFPTHPALLLHSGKSHLPGTHLFTHTPRLEPGYRRRSCPSVLANYESFNTLRSLPGRAHSARQPLRPVESTESLHRGLT